MNFDNLFTHGKLASVSIAGAIGGMTLDDTTQIGQIVAIVVSIISGISSLVKMFKRKKP
jgi:hypothetical protein